MGANLIELVYGVLTYDKTPSESIGAAEVTELRAREGRLDTVGSRWEGATAEKAKLVSERQRCEAALVARRSATEAVEDMRARREAAKEQFLDVYAQVAAGVKAEFPRNRQMQELFFAPLFGKEAQETSAEQREVPRSHEKRLHS